MRQRGHAQRQLVVAAAGQRPGRKGSKAAVPVAEGPADADAAAELAAERQQSVAAVAALTAEQQQRLDALAEAISERLGALAESDDWTPGARAVGWAVASGPLFWP